MNAEKHLEKTELLLPAGELETLKTALVYGADAVYCGLPSLSLRAKAGFSSDDLKEGVEFAKKLNKKVYLAVNLFAKNLQIKEIEEAIDTIKSLSPDGLIVADAGVFSLLRKSLSDMHITLSTQANVSNTAAVNFWKNAGADRIVLARECGFNDLKEICANPECPEIECFVHGAMCMSISGRCLISNFLSARGANQGECSQSCRWDYKLYALEEKTRVGEFFEIFEDGGFSHILSSKDLCLMPVLDKYLALGLSSFKIEGRHKNAFYIANIARAYRFAIDEWYRLKSESQEGNWDYRPFLEMLNSVKNRGFTLGFHGGEAGALSSDFESTKSVGEYQFAGIVRNFVGNSIIFEVRNTLNIGDDLEFLIPQDSQVHRITLDKIVDAKSKNEIARASAGQDFCIEIKLKNADELRQKIAEFCVAKIKCSDENKNKIQERNIQFGREICEV